MASTEDPKGAQAPNSDSSREHGAGSGPPSESKVSYSQTTDDPYGYDNDPYSYQGVVETSAVAVTTPPASPPLVKSGGRRGAPPPPRPPDNGGDEEKGMPALSFLARLEELRARSIR